MSLKPQGVGPVPETTARVAHAAFPKGNAIMHLRDSLGPIYTDEQFRPLFPHDGQPALSPGLLALVTVLQFAEGLSDRQAAEAVWARIDWKYAPGLELDDAGFDASVLSEFRSRLIAGQAEMLLFETLLSLLREQGLLKARGKQRTDSTHVLAAIVMLNRLECAGETLRHALNVLATVAPDWLQQRVPVAWFERYARRFEQYRLPTKKEERYAWPSKLGPMAATSCRCSMLKPSGHGCVRLPPSRSFGVSGLSSFMPPSPANLFAGVSQRIFPPPHS